MASHELRSASAAAAVATGGAAAGVLDLLAAFALQWTLGVSPIRVLQAIASGLLGTPAFRGGAATAALGLVLHFFIAFGAAAVYNALVRAWRLPLRHPTAAGLAYGGVVYLFMNLVVLPASRGTFRPPSWPVALTLIVIHMVCVGLPIAWAARNAAERSPSAAAASAGPRPS